MRILAWIVGIVVGGPIALAVLIYWSYPSGSYQYRLTVEVETASGVRTGTAVREIQWKAGPLTIAPSSFRLVGQAVAVDLGPHGVLLALLGSSFRSPNPSDGRASGATWVVLEVFRSQISARVASYRVTRNMSYDVIKALRDMAGETADLGPGTWPSFAWLPNPDDPTSAQVVSITQLQDVIAPDVRLRRVWIELVRGRPTATLGATLPWLRGFMTLPREEAGILSRGILQQHYLSQGVTP